MKHLSAIAVAVLLLICAPVSAQVVYRVGSVFACNLSSALRGMPGVADLKIVTEDASGNTMEYTIAPAFAMKVMKRRVAHLGH